jgi:thioredoxin-related protein
MAAPRLAEDGMYYFDWYLQSFLDLQEDVATAVSNGKHLAVVWQQRACPFCRRMALEHLSTPEIADYVRSHFEILHLDLHGDRETTDFDRKVMPERRLAQTYGVRLTPTIQFFPDVTEGLETRPPQQREVARMPGLLEPKPFLAMFRYVQERGYEKEGFQSWLARQS